MRRSLPLLLLVVALWGVAAGRAAAQPRPLPLSVTLAAGWNNVAYVGAPRPYAAAFASLAGRYEAVWTWDQRAQRWLGLNPLAPAGADFTQIEQNQPYWIKMSSAGELLMEVPPTQPPVLLTPGWNNFVYVGPEHPLPDALADAAGRFRVVWRWDAGRQSWNGFAPETAFASDFSTLGPYRSYFVKLEAGPIVALTPSVPTGLSPGVAFSGPGGPSPSATPTRATGGASSTPTGTPTPTPSAHCYTFQSYQPQLTEVSRALSKAAFGQLTADQDFKIKELETQPDGDGAVVAAYIPPTLLKAIAWIETGWRQSSFATQRGNAGPTITSRSCAYGLMQLLTGMEIGGTPTPRQQKIGTDYLFNVAAGAQVLGIKWNLAPSVIPPVLPRDPRALESWYYAVWAYHCFGDRCDALGVHNHPEDPALKWPRPVYNSPEQLASGGQLTYTDYPYQELVYGVIAYPPKVNNTALWPAIPVALPPHGAVSYPDPQPMTATSATLDPTTADAQ